MFNQMKNCSFLHPYFLLLKSFCLRSNIKHSTMFYDQMKHLRVCQKYCAAHDIFDSLLSVSYGDETLCLMLDILLLKFPRSYIDPGGGGGGRDIITITTCYQWVPNWLFWLWDLPYLKARIWGLKATW